MSETEQQKVMLVIIDGYGETTETKGNAILEAKTPYIDSLKNDWPSLLVAAHGEAVGLPPGAMGSSEVGHSTIGAAKVILQPLLYINQAIDGQTFFANSVLTKACQDVKKRGADLHLVGLLSDGGIHSHILHLEALLQLCLEQGIENVYIHAISDGRDVAERSLKNYAQSVEVMCEKFSIGKLVDMVGRFYAMDRDTNFERTKVAYDLYTKGTGEIYEDTNSAIESFYETSEHSDYYFPASRLVDGDEGLIKKDDTVIFFNFRSDRAKQITAAFSDPEFKDFPIDWSIAEGNYIGFGPFGDYIKIAFDPMQGINNIGKLISEAGLNQLRVAETEKYAHVTYFMNCQEDEPYPNEDRVLVPSDKVRSFAEQPEMSADELTDEAILALEKSAHQFIAVNYANLDLVGHSGDYKATVKACETIDVELKKLVTAALENNYQILIVGDHGNAEAMLTAEGEQNPSHTTNPTRLHLLGEFTKDLKLAEIKDPSLAHVGSTILQLLNLEKAEGMVDGLIKQA